MRPHTFQGPSTGRAPESKPFEQREQRQKPWRSSTSDRSSPVCDSPGTRTHTTGKTQDRLHTCSHTHKHAHTHAHMLTHAHSLFLQVNIFIQKPDYQARDLFQELTGHNFQVERRKTTSESPVYRRTPYPNLRSSPAEQARVGPRGLLPE